MLTNKGTTYILLDKTAGEDLALLKEIESLDEMQLETKTMRKLYPMLYELRYLLREEVFGEE